MVRGMAKHVTSDTGQMRLIFLFAYTLNPGDKNTACYKGLHQGCTWEQSKQSRANFVISRESGTSGSHARIWLVCLNNSMVRQRSWSPLLSDKYKLCLVPMVRKFGWLRGPRFGNRARRGACGSALPGPPDFHYISRYKLYWVPLLGLISLHVSKWSFKMWKFLMSWFLSYIYHAKGDLHWCTQTTKKAQVEEPTVFPSHTILRKA